MRQYLLDGMNKIILFVLPLLIFAGCSEYRDYYAWEHAQYVVEDYISSSGSDPNLYILPDVKVKDTLVSQFDSAKSRIWVEIYTWTERDTIDALIRAHNRWVDTRVVLEGNVYGTPRINDETFEKLQWSGVLVTYADNDRYNFTHAKFWLIDDWYCVSTWNFTYSSFEKNRDIIVCDTKKEVLSILENTYLADQKKMQPVFSGSILANIAMSPINMRSNLLAFIQSAQKNLFVYVQSVSDEEILKMLEQKYKLWVDVRLCVADNESDNSFSGYSFPISTIKKPYLHAKAILKDGEDSMIGSVNLTQNGIDNNREVSLFYKNSSKIYKAIEFVFLKDCFPSKFAK